MRMVKVKSAYKPSGSSGRSLYRFEAWSDQEYFFSPLDGMPVYRRVTPSIKFAGTHLYTWVKRGTVRVKCLAQEHNTMSPVRTRTQTARSGVARTNHEATAPPTDMRMVYLLHFGDVSAFSVDWRPKKILANKIDYQWHTDILGRVTECGITSLTTAS